MASNRHLGRIVALQTLYEQDFRAAITDSTFDLTEVLERNIARYESTLQDVEFVRGLVHGVLEKKDELDDELRPLAPEWPLETIARVDRVVLRMGLYELKYSSDSVPHKVVINEAVELAKGFGSENSSRFINGVLGTALRQLIGETDAELPEAETEEKPAAKGDKPDTKPKKAKKAD